VIEGGDEVKPFRYNLREAVKNNYPGVLVNRENLGRLNLDSIASPPFSGDGILPIMIVFRLYVQTHEGSHCELDTSLLMEGDDLNDRELVMSLCQEDIDKEKILGYFLETCEIDLNSVTASGMSRNQTPTVKFDVLSVTFFG
jgi:hypothetical protein